MSCVTSSVSEERNRIMDEESRRRPGRRRPPGEPKEEVGVFELAVGAERPGARDSPVTPRNAPQTPAGAGAQDGSGPRPKAQARGVARARALQNVPTRPPRRRHAPHPPRCSQCAGAGRTRAGDVIWSRTPPGKVSRSDGVAMEPSAGEAPPRGSPERRARGAEGPPGMRQRARQRQAGTWRGRWGRSGVWS